MILMSIPMLALLIALSFIMPALGFGWMLWITIPGCVLVVVELIFWIWVIRNVSAAMQSKDAQFAVQEFPKN